MDVIDANTHKVKKWKQSRRDLMELVNKDIQFINSTETCNTEDSLTAEIDSYLSSEFHTGDMLPVEISNYSPPKSLQTEIGIISPEEFPSHNEVNALYVQTTCNESLQLDLAGRSAAVPGNPGVPLIHEQIQNFLVPSISVNNEMETSELNWNEDMDSDIFDITSTVLDTSSDDESIEKSYMGAHLSNELGSWSVDTNVSNSAFNKLLKILHTYHPNLPLDARTILGTSSEGITKQLVNGQYCHFGLKNGLIKLLQLGYNISTMVSLSFNVDGLPLFKSSSVSFWPILCIIKNQFVGVEALKPIVIGIFCGKGKPNTLSDFLKDFIQECLLLFTDGFTFEDREFKILLDGPFICDAPAKCSLKGVIAFNGYYGCDRCITKGQWHGRMTFPDISCALRTDENFRNMTQKQHHNDYSPLLILPINMVSQFPLDYMHLVCLGVVKRIMLFWKKAKFTSRLQASQLAEISEALNCLRQFCPNEFARKPRGLNEMERWKATEFRQFLFYSGPVVLKPVLGPDYYDHFILLHLAIRILSSKKYMYLVDYAEQLLQVFVQRSLILYGKEFVVYNVHCLVHLASDVRLYGPLDNFSAFPYENFLQELKSLVRTPNRPLAQVCRRIGESLAFAKPINQPINSENEWNACGELKREPALPFLKGKQFKKMKNSKFTIGIRMNDNCCILKSGEIILVQNIVQDNGTLYIIYQRFLTVGNLYSYPVKSSKMQTYLVSNQSTNQLLPAREIRMKCYLLPLLNKFVVIPMLH